jgi:hypothetical protein
MRTLQVGKTYRDGCKYAYTISENTKGDKVRYPFRGTNERTGDSRTYTPYGVHVKSAPSIVDDLIIPDERHTDPVTNPSWDWRITPAAPPKRTVQIGKRTVIAPEVEAPAVGRDYWVMYCDYIEEWNNDSTDFALLSEGRVFLDAKDGRTCQVAIQALLLGND